MIAFGDGQDLGSADLRLLARELRAQPSLWEHRVRHEPEQRVYEMLLHDEHVMAYLICWMDGHDTGFHDHDVSAGAVAVVRGRIREQRLRVGREPSTRIYGAGDLLEFSASDIHRVSHAPGAPAVTIHVYSPPLARMGAYVIEPDGNLLRQPQLYSEELRPLAA